MKTTRRGFWAALFGGAASGILTGSAQAAPSPSVVVHPPIHVTTMQIEIDEPDPDRVMLVPKLRSMAYERERLPPLTDVGPVQSGTLREYVR